MRGLQLKKACRRLQRVIAGRQGLGVVVGPSQQGVGPVAIATPGDQAARRIHVGPLPRHDAALQVGNDAFFNGLERHRIGQLVGMQAAQQGGDVQLFGHGAGQLVVAGVVGHVAAPTASEHAGVRGARPVSDDK